MYRYLVVTVLWVFAGLGIQATMNWVQRKIYLYNVTFGLYMLDWWERYLFSILDASIIELELFNYFCHAFFSSCQLLVGRLAIFLFSYTCHFQVTFSSATAWYDLNLVPICYYLTTITIKCHFAVEDEYLLSLLISSAHENHTSYDVITLEETGITEVVCCWTHRLVFC